MREGTFRRSNEWNDVLRKRRARESAWARRNLAAETCVLCGPRVPPFCTTKRRIRRKVGEAIREDNVMRRGFDSASGCA